MRRVSPLIWIVVAAAAVAALFAEGAPTGLDAADAVWRAAFAAVVTLCAAVASRWTWIVASAVGAVAAVGPRRYVYALFWRGARRCSRLFPSAARHEVRATRKWPVW